MTRDAILTELKAERDRLNAAIAALEGGRRGPGRPKGAHAVPKRRTMSAAARKRISEAMKATWAARKSPKGAASAPASKPPKRRTMSAAARRRIAQAKKAWWAAQKKAS